MLVISNVIIFFNGYEVFFPSGIEGHIQNFGGPYIVGS